MLGFVLGDLGAGPRKQGSALVLSESGAIQ